FSQGRTKLPGVSLRSTKSARRILGRVGLEVLLASIVGPRFLGFYRTARARERVGLPGFGSQTVASGGIGRTIGSPTFPAASTIAATSTSQRGTEQEKRIRRSPFSCG